MIDCSRRRSAHSVFKVKWLPLASVALLFALLTGCSTIKAPKFLPFPSEKGGIPAEQVLDISNIVNRVRTEYPDRSAAVPYEPRSFGKSYAPSSPVLALFGDGKGIDSGEAMHVKVYLDKRDYTSGYVEITWEGQARETAYIIGYDHKGRPDAVFDYIYAMGREDGGVYYLDLVGGEYGGMNVKYVGYEGTLIIPGPGQSLKAGTKVFKLDFGFRFPLPPEYKAHVNRADDLSGSISKRMKELQSANDALGKIRDELTALRNTPPAEDKVAAQEKKVQGLEAKSSSLRSEIEETTRLLEGLFSDYFTTRQTISNSFTSFLSSNHYTWIAPDDQLDYWKQWRSVQRYDEIVEGAFQPFLNFAENPDRLGGDRKQMLRTIEQNDIKSRDPGVR